MKAVTWQAVLLFAIGLAGFITLYILVPPTDPMRGALVTAFNALIGAVVVAAVNRRGQQVETKVDQVIREQASVAADLQDGQAPGSHRAGG